MGQGQQKGRHTQGGQPVASTVLRNALRSTQQPYSNALAANSVAAAGAGGQQGAGAQQTGPQTRDVAVPFRHSDGSGGSSSRRDSDAHAPPSHQHASTIAVQTDSPPPQQQQQQQQQHLVEVPIVIRFKPPPQQQQQQQQHQSQQQQQPQPQAKPEVKLLMEHHSWKPIAMTPSSDEFFAIVYVPRGEQAYKFTVNGEPMLDTQQTVRGVGEPANVVNVADTLLFSKEDDDPSSLDEAAGWGQEQVTFDESRKFPSILPPHMRYTPLNTPPAQYRCDKDGNLLVVPHGAPVLDPVHLPLPLSVTVNHVYFQRREDHTVIGSTTRYRNKYTSVIYYRAVSEQQQQDHQHTHHGQQPHHHHPHHGAPIA